MPVVTEETVKKRHSRLRREYGDMFDDAAPVMMMEGSEDDVYAVIEQAISTKKAIVIDWPDGIDA